MGKIFVSYQKNDSFIEFIDEDNNKSIYATNSVIFVDDTDDYISIKLTASRKTVGLLKKN